MPTALTRPRTVWSLLVVGLAIATSATMSILAINTALWLVGTLAAATLTVRAARSGTPTGRRVWRAITGALVLMALGRTLGGFVAPNVTHPLRGVPADLLMVIGFAALIAAAVIALRASHASRDRAAVLDGLIVVVASGMLASHFIVASVWDGQLATTRLLWSQSLHILIDLAIIGVAVRLWFSTSEAAQRATRWIAIGILLLGFGDLLTVAARSTLELNNVRWLTLANICYAVFILLIGLAALDESRDRFTESSATRGLRSPARTVLMLLIVLITPLFILISDNNRGGDLDSALLGPATLVLFILVAVRIWLLVRAFNSAALHSLVLQQVHNDDSLDRASLIARVPSWVSRITGRNDLVCTIAASPSAHDTTDAKTFPIGHESPYLQLTVVSFRPLSDADCSVISDLVEALNDQLDRIAMRSSLINLAAENRASQLLANSADAIVVLDDDLTVHYATPRFAELSGLFDGGVGLPLTEVLAPEAAATLTLLTDQCHNDGEAHASLSLHDFADVLRHFDAIAVWLDDEQRYVLTLRDVSEHQQLRAELAQRAYYDQLTGLANRELFRERLVEAIQRQERYGVPFAVLVLDLDDFKSVNDTLGHPAGDVLLRHVADQIREVLRAGDTAARLGGDEFALIVEGAETSAEAGIVADRLLAGLSASITIEGRAVSPRASVGIALSSDGSNTTELERNADLALYDAKGAGKGRWSAFHRDLHAEAMHRLTLSSRIRDALARDEIVPCYQPIVDLRNGQVVGIEALARWNNPEHGVMLAADFLFSASDSELVIDVGTHILARSVRDLARLDQALGSRFPLTLSVNMSTRQMHDPNTCTMVQETLGKHDIDATRVMLEITESALLPGDGVTPERLDEFKALGLRLFLDDFGTGWSSLGYLRTLPVSGLKLASDFVQSLPNKRDLGLVAAVRALADTLSLEPVIAEGIETEAQRQALVGEGYVLGQGHLFAPPMTFDELIGYLSHSPVDGWTYPSRGAEFPSPESVGGESSTVEVLAPSVEG